LLEFEQLRHARLKFTNRRLAVVTAADDRPRLELVPGHARRPCFALDDAPKVYYEQAIATVTAWPELEVTAVWCRTWSRKET
jgi:hypothetical protein